MLIKIISFLLFIPLSYLLVRWTYLSFRDNICRAPVYLDYGMIVGYFLIGILSWFWLIPFTLAGIGLWMVWRDIIADRIHKIQRGEKVCGGIGFATGAGSTIAKLWGGPIFGKILGDTVNDIGESCLNSAIEHYSQDSEIAWKGKYGNIACTVAIIIVIIISWSWK
ncbi:MAG: hypothetical protein ACTTJ7_00835 [Treponema sp.]